jgi:hypothetical protein
VGKGYRFPPLGEPATSSVVPDLRPTLPFGHRLAAIDDCGRGGSGPALLRGGRPMPHLHALQHLPGGHVMASRVTLSADPGGIIVVTKTPLAGDGADRRAEAAWLDRARGRSVVDLLDVHHAPVVEIVTRFVPGDTLRTSRLSPGETARVLSGVATTLLQLHERGLVHGKLTPDHVIVSEHGPVLCSPHGLVSEPTVDCVGLGRCIDAVLARWRESGVEPNDPAPWRRLSDRLADPARPLPLRRAIRVLDQLAATGGDPPRADGSVPHGIRSEPGPERPIPWGALLVGLAVALSLGGLIVSRPDRRTRTPAIGAIEIVSNGQRYRVGRDGDRAVVVSDPCEGQPAIIVLDQSSDIVYRFDEPVDGSVGDVVASVPGASALAVDPGQPCPQAWATGPAGRTRLPLDPP